MCMRKHTVSSVFFLGELHPGSFASSRNEISRCGRNLFCPQNRDVHRKRPSAYTAGTVNVVLLWGGEVSVLGTDISCLVNNGKGSLPRAVFLKTLMALHAKDLGPIKRTHSSSKKKNTSRHGVDRDVCPSPGRQHVRGQAGLHSRAGVNRLQGVLNPPAAPLYAH